MAQHLPSGAPGEIMESPEISGFDLVSKKMCSKIYCKGSSCSSRLVYLHRLGWDGHPNIPLILVSSHGFSVAQTRFLLRLPPNSKIDSSLAIDMVLWQPQPPFVSGWKSMKHSHRFECFVSRTCCWQVLNRCAIIQYSQKFNFSNRLWVGPFDVCKSSMMKASTCPPGTPKNTKTKMYVFPLSKHVWCRSFNCFLFRQ